MKKLTPMALQSLVFSLLTILLVLAKTEPVLCEYTSIFSFGDSYTDTGNLICLYPNESGFHFPYGETYFGHPTGRFSNGRLIVDFLAQSLGLPLLPPYLARKSGQEFRRGVNFAVAGATALDNAFFEERGIDYPYTNISLGNQLSWFKELLPSLCDQSSNLYSLWGEIGGNDYVYSFSAGRSLEEIRTFVPDVIDAISSAIQLVVKHGAVTVMVPGNIPMGCLSLFLTQFQSSNEEDYDPQTGCLRWLNEFSMYHNHLLQKELNRMQELHPHVTFIYADYYNASMRFFRHPHQFGFSKGSLTACCGGGGPYNYNKSLLCGNRGASVLNDPSLYADWDGEHMTEAAYKTIASYILQGFNDIPDSSHQYLTLITSKEYRASLLQNS
ncbi:hypothetical protein HHK36_032592 [Tetracentron sinense]|uniref:Uncharacterized protein n=1 Tax=Tetracentron sinense TaxID=13715 RepID=A0A834Y597_TETSI|nr:hypothetical protein HHK36_032592 [Tetracentron sinense]